MKTATQPNKKGKRQIKSAVDRVLRMHRQERKELGLFYVLMPVAVVALQVPKLVLTKTRKQLSPEPLMPKEMSGSKQGQCRLHVRENGGIQLQELVSMHCCC